MRWPTGRGKDLGPKKIPQSLAGLGGLHPVLLHLPTRSPFRASLVKRPLKPVPRRQKRIPFGPTGFLAPGSSYLPRLPTPKEAVTLKSSQLKRQLLPGCRPICGFRPRLQRRDRDGFKPSSPLSPIRAPAPIFVHLVNCLRGSVKDFQSTRLS